MNGSLQNILVSFAAAFASGVLLEGMLLPLLRRLKAGQSIREDGPQAHLAKAGTPTMGGLAIIAAVCISGFVIYMRCGRPDTVPIIVFVTLAYGAVGFADDYLKVVKHQNEGLNPRQKIILQLIVAAVLAVYEYSRGHMMFVPLFRIYVDLGIFTVPFLIFVLLAMTNAVNLNDGLDGLCSSVSSAVSLFFVWLGGFAASHSYMTDFDIPSYLAAALMGGCLAFLCYNRHPAKVFMGDTGSLAIGGCLAAIGITGGCELLLPIAGFVYVAEALSVIIQVYVFKTQNGRRFFRMAPIHHHFELGGWSEVKVVRMFVLATGVFCLAASVMI